MKSEFEETPFPRLGEVVHFIVHAFGLFGRGDALRKRLKRFAKESEFNLTEANQIIDEALLKPLREINEPFADEMAVWITKLLDDYKTIILTVPTEIVPRTVVLKILASKAGHFIPSTIMFLNTFQKQCPDAPDFKQWFESKDIIAVNKVLFWWMKTYAVSENRLFDFLKICPPENKQYEDMKESFYRNLRRWKSGTLPESSQFRIFKPEQGGDNLVIWLLLARAWQSICKTIEKRFGEKGLTSFIKIVNDTYQTMSDNFEVNPERIEKALFIVLTQLNGTNNSQKRAIDSLYHSFDENCWQPFQNISLLHEKMAGEEIQAQATLKAIEQHKFYPCYQYLSEHGWGRYYAMCCEYTKALEHYQRAFELGKYRAGEHLFDILRELLTLAAFLEKKVIIKSHYQWACLMDLFSGEGDAPEQWEIKQFKMAFFEQFPLHGLYQCVPEAKKAEMVQKQEEVFRSAKTFYEEGWKKWKKISPDLRKPNRMVKNFGAKPVTQLMIFTHLKQIDKVKRLLEAGADPNIPIKLDNSTALIIALQNGNTEIAKLLLEHPKIADSINARTRRKNITALQVAIEKGYVDIVRLLIEKGTDIEQLCDLEKLSPLYNAITSFKNKKILCATGLLPPIPKENISPDVFRRCSEFIEVFLSGNVFNQDFPDRNTLLIEKLQNASPKESKMFKRLFANKDLSKCLQIIEILIEAGADVNKPHLRLHGFTPFLYSAEVGDLEIFRRLYEAGGNLTDCLDNGASILSIALTYSNFNIAAYILEHGDKEQLRQIINAQNKSKGFTALYHFIIQFRDLKKSGLYSDETMNDWKQTIWDNLLDLEPDLTLKDKMGLTAEMLADKLSMPLFALDLHKRHSGV